MKCIKNTKTNEIVRVTDDKAAELVTSSTHVYVPKSEWKAQRK
jgi:hypothetical protein